MNRRVALGWHFALGAAACIVLGVIAAALTMRMLPGATSTNHEIGPMVAKCRLDRFQSLQPPPQSLAVLDEIARGCYQQVHSDLLLEDFSIRREKFGQQGREGAVLLTVVVAITLSGVALSAVQLMATYKLATEGKGQLAESTELAIESQRLTVRSSVTGLVMLACSFAFFAVYATAVHPLRECSSDASARAGTPVQIETTPGEPTGGLGVKER